MSGYFTEHCVNASSLGNLIFPKSLNKNFEILFFFFCILLFELQPRLKMFWRWCRNTFSNVAKQGIIPLLEPLFVFNPICQAVERERERERALHLGEISLNYIDSVQIVVDRQRALAGEILLRYVQSSLRAKYIGLRF